MPQITDRIFVPRSERLRGTARLFAAVALTALVCTPLFAQFSGFEPHNLVVSRSVYEGTATTVTVGETLPPNCPTATATCTGGSNGGPATNNGAFPVVGSTNNVWNNDTVDGSFGVTSPIFLDQITTGGALINSLAIPTTGPNQIVTSFSSKSELALNLSLDGKYITFMGYLSNMNALDVSNANTNGVIDPTNPVGEEVDRGVAQVDTNGNIRVTDTWLYSGNNGRAAIYLGDSNPFYFTVGNDNNGAQPTTGPPYTPVLTELVASTGVQVVVPGSAPSTNFVAAGVYPPAAGDKPGKDNNFRGLTIFNNTLYVTKGSGSNGIDTVYQVGTAGTLPTSGGTVITVLPGFPTAKAKTAGINNVYPFGIWFANATTLYVGDEGDGVVADAPNSIYAGLQKWSLVSGSWHLDYVLQNGLNLGVQYGVPNYPPAINPATAGLRNITGRVNGDGTVTIWAVTSTVSANGDQGADPNLLVAITDTLAFTTPSQASGEQFSLVRAANYGEVLRGVSLTPFSNLTVPTITFTGAPSSAPYNSTFTVAATTNASTTPSITASGACSILGDLVTMTSGTGTCMLTASWAADSTYNAATATQTTTATQATPVVTWSAPAAITFGGALGNGQLDATASVPGTFVYTPAAGTVLPVGNNEPLSVSFTPTDTTDYTTATGFTTITVNPAPASGVNLVVTKVLTRTGGNVVVTLTIANTGGTAAANVLLSSVKVGADTATPLPQNIGAIGAGASATTTVTVPGSVGASGAASSLTLSGTYTGGTFSSSARITLP